MHNLSLGSWPRRRARFNPEGIAWTYLPDDGSDPVSSTFGEVHERTSRLAGALAVAGIGPGDRVAYVGFNHPALLEVLFATSQAGAITVLMNPRLAPAELDFIVGDSSPKVIFHGADVAEWAGASEAVRGIRSVSVEQEYEAFLSAGALAPEQPRGLDDVCLIMYTSGTTGRPKGAMLTHGNILFNDLNQLIAVDFHSDEVCLDIGPLFHIAALNGLALPVFLKGGRQIIRPKFRVEDTFDDVAKYGITSTFAVPLMVDMLAQHPLFDTADLSTLRTLIVGGAPVPDRILRRYAEHGIGVQQGYGLTETSPGAMLLTAQHAITKSGSAGVTQFFVDTRIVGEDGQDADPHVPGEILIRGPVVTPGYWGLPAATDAAFTDGWFRSGDIGTYDEDGFAFLVDRAKDMYISGGENVYPAEVENKLLEIPGVAEAVVIGVPDERWGESGLAYVVPGTGAEITGEGVLAQLTGQLAKYKIPARVVVRTELPRTATGKVKKHELRAEHIAAQKTVNAGDAGR